MKSLNFRRNDNPTWPYTACTFPAISDVITSRVYEFVDMAQDMILSRARDTCYESSLNIEVWPEGEECEVLKLQGKS